MKIEVRVAAAKKLLALARELSAQDGEEEVVDEKFAARIRTLRQTMTKLLPKKSRRLQQFGIERILPTATVEDLVAALEKVLAS